MHLGQPREPVLAAWLITESGQRVLPGLAPVANVQDREALPYLLHGNETRVWGDQGYQGQIAVIHQRAPNAKGFTNQRYRSRVCAKVEHVFGVIKNIFGFRKVRYCGLLS